MAVASAAYASNAGYAASSGSVNLGVVTQSASDVGSGSTFNTVDAVATVTLPAGGSRLAIIRRGAGTSTVLGNLISGYDVEAVVAAGGTTFTAIGRSSTDHLGSYIVTIGYAEIKVVSFKIL